MDNKIQNLSDENENFQIRIIDFYKDVDKPLITNLYNDNEGKDLLKISLKNELSLLKKEKNKWQIKDKRKLLKEIDIVKKRKVKEITSNFNNITKPGQTIKILKDTNNKLISEIESIDDFKKNIEDDKLYERLKNLALMSYTKTDLTKKGGAKKKKKEELINIKIIDIKQKNTTDSESESDFIEIFSN
jgi:hypothetical protein